MDVNERRKYEFQLHKEAESLMIKEHHSYFANTKKDKNLDYSWIRSVLAKGTLSDKIAANVLLMQDSPKANLKCLEFLVELMNPKGKFYSYLLNDQIISYILILISISFFIQQNVNQ